MLLLKSFSKHLDRSKVLLADPSNSLSLRIRVWHPNTRRYVRLLGPCFKTGRLKPLCQHPKLERVRRPAIKASCSPQSHPVYVAIGYNISRGKSHSYYLYPPDKTDVDPFQGSRPAELAESKEHDWLQSFPFQQFHVLFNSLSKVLFIFPSRYLFAIGLSPIFSFRWNSPPILSCIPKQLDS